MDRVSDFLISRNGLAHVACSTNVDRAAEEYRESLYDLGDGRIDCSDVLTRIRALRRSLARRRSIR
jgi:hypothetical protein